MDGERNRVLRERRAELRSEGAEPELAAELLAERIASEILIAEQLGLGDYAPCKSPSVYSEHAGVVSPPTFLIFRCGFPHCGRDDGRAFVGCDRDHHRPDPANCFCKTVQGVGPMRWVDRCPIEPINNGQRLRTTQKSPPSARHEQPENTRARLPPKGGLSLRGDNVTFCDFRPCSRAVRDPQRTSPTPLAPESKREGGAREATMLTAKMLAAISLAVMATASTIPTNAPAMDMGSPAVARGPAYVPRGGPRYRGGGFGGAGAVGLIGGMVLGGMLSAAVRDPQPAAWEGLTNAPDPARVNQRLRDGTERERRIERTRAAYGRSERAFGAEVNPDGSVALPGIETDAYGRTIYRSPNRRDIDSVPQERLGAHRPDPNRRIGLNSVPTPSHPAFR